MLLIDWTRMGKFYCLAGAIYEGGQYRIVRPLQFMFRDAPVRNVGWSPYQVDGYSRWQFFELVGSQPAKSEPPHLEDVWVRSLEPHHCSANRDLRQAVLAATTVKPGDPLFGVHLTPSYLAAYLRPGTGIRSLATLLVPAGQITFRAALRDGADEPDVRVTLHIPGLEGRFLPVKDHHLLLRAEKAGDNMQDMNWVLNEAVRQMGDPVAVRLGLSRAFPPREDCGPGYCWLMADGFFSFTDPQP
jgi:hypothetical protein